MGTVEGPIGGQLPEVVVQLHRPVEPVIGQPVVRAEAAPVIGQPPAVGQPPVESGAVRVARAVETGYTNYRNWANGEGLTGRAQQVRRARADNLSLVVRAGATGVVGTVVLLGLVNHLVPSGEAEAPETAVVAPATAGIPEGAIEVKPLNSLVAERSYQPDQGPEVVVTAHESGSEGDQVTIQVRQGREMESYEGPPGPDHITKVRVPDGGADVYVDSQPEQPKQGDFVVYYHDPTP